MGDSIIEIQVSGVKAVSISICLKGEIVSS